MLTSLSVPLQAVERHNLGADFFQGNNSIQSVEVQSQYCSTSVILQKPTNIPCQLSWKTFKTSLIHISSLKAQTGFTLNQPRPTVAGFVVSFPNRG